MAILVGITHPDAAAVFELHLTGSLDLHEEQVDDVIDPEQRPIAGVRLLPFGAREIRHQLAPFQPAAQPHVLEFRIKVAQIHVDEVGRDSLDGIQVRLAALPVALQQRLVVAGDQSLAATVRVDQLPGLELRFEPGAQRNAVPCDETLRGKAGLTPDLSPLQRSAGRKKGGKSRAEIVLAPTRQTFPRGRLERLGRRLGQFGRRADRALQYRLRRRL